MTSLVLLVAAVALAALMLSRLAVNEARRAVQLAEDARARASHPARPFDGP